jgi:hypothetical protein
MLWNASKKQVDGEEGDDENDGNALGSNCNFLSLEQETTAPAYLNFFQSYSTVGVVPAFHPSLLRNRKYPLIPDANRH